MRVDEHGVREDGPDIHDWRNAGNVVPGWDALELELTDERLARVTRIRYLSDVGFPVWELSYAYGVDCPEAEPALVELFTTDRSHAEDREALGAAYQACHDRLADEGVDLASFTTPDSAADLADLRVALGYDEWNVYGLSYGTRLAMEAMRSHPEGIRSVVLDSPYPMDVGTVGQAVDGAQHGIDRLVEGCAADPTCAEAHPDLAGEVDAIVERYDAEPYRSTIDLADGGATEIVFRGDDLVGGFYDAIYGHSLIPALPTAVGSIAAGDGTIIDAVAAESIPLQAGGAEAMGHLVDCADAGPLRDADPGADQEFLDDPGRWGTTVLLVTWAWCDIWDDGAVDAAFVEPVTADVPVLVLSGTYDPATPTPGAQEVADALPDATLVTFEGHGHGLWNDSECAIDLADRFVTDPGAPLDTSCAEAIEPPAFG